MVLNYRDPFSFWPFVELIDCNFYIRIYAYINLPFGTGIGLPISFAV